MNLGQLIDKMNTTREARRKLSEEDKKLEAEYKDLEAKVMAKLDAEDMDKATGKAATVSISKATVANVKDWALVEKYVKRTGHFQLFQRRISEPAFRELLALKKAEIPGIEAFEKKSLNLRAL